MIPCKGCGNPIVSHGSKTRCPDCQLAHKRNRLWKQFDEKRRAEEETAARVARIEAAAPPPPDQLDDDDERASEPLLRAHDVARPAAVSASVVEARDAAVLRYLERHDGVASQKELLASIPKDDPATTADAKLEALKQSLARLKFKRLIGRTGDTYSLVGAGSEVAHA